MHINTNINPTMLLSVTCLSIMIFSKAILTAAQNEKCLRSFSLSLEECMNPSSMRATNRANTTCITSSQDLTCQKTFKLGVIEKVPYDTRLIPFLMRQVLQSCCGKCSKLEVTKKFSNSTEFGTAVTQQNENLDIHFAFPVLRDHSSSYLYEKRFIPMFNLEGVVIITPEIDPKTMIIQLSDSVLDLWPLLFVTLLLAFVAGFMGWILDTWSNEEEFPRSFVKGVFEGSWWAFISMTTVGYGDKSPRSWSARAFSILWILIGITICSMLTASLSASIAAANSPQDPEIRGKKIGVLIDRLFDLSYVAEEGGKPKATKTVDELIRLMNDETIDGFVLDKLTYVNYQSLLNKFVKTEKNYDSSHLSYGILVFNESDYQYFAPFLRDNGLYLQTCTLGLLAANDEGSEELTNIFSIESGLFLLACVSLLAMILLIVIFGVVYEFMRNKKRKQRVEITMDGASVNTETSMITDIEGLVTKWKAGGDTYTEIRT